MKRVCRPAHIDRCISITIEIDTTRLPKDSEVPSDNLSEDTIYGSSADVWLLIRSEIVVAA
jgi:hypothetical protein